MAFWWAVDDCTLENGCLWVVPGSHKDGIATRFKRNEQGTATFLDVPDPDEAAPFKSLKDKYPKENSAVNWVPLTCKKGTLIVIHDSVVHMSERNTSQQTRHAYTFHMVERSAKWSPDNWLQRPEDNPFKSFEEL